MRGAWQTLGGLVALALAACSDPAAPPGPSPASSGTSGGTSSGTLSGTSGGGEASGAGAAGGQASDGGAGGTGGEAAGGAGGAGIGGAPVVNEDPGRLVVWEQNLAKLQLRPAALLDCMQDAACGGELLPDILLVNEANAEVGVEFAARMTKRLGTTYLAFGHASRAGTSVIWRKARLGSALETASIAPFHLNASESCERIEPSVHGATVPTAKGVMNTGRNVAVRFEDKLSKKRVVAISVHFPHPYEGGIPNCEKPELDYDGICVRRNIVDVDGLLAGADLQLLGGDFNYKSLCGDAVAGGYKIATDQPSGNFTPRFYADAAEKPGGRIDYIFARRGDPAAGPAPAFPGYARVAKGFYCKEGEAPETCAWSDHDLFRAIVAYP